MWRSIPVLCWLFSTTSFVGSLLAAAPGHDGASEVKTTTWRASESSILGVAFARDSKSFWAASEDGATKLWNVAEKKVTLQLGGPGQRVNAVAVSHDGKTVATGGRGALNLWDAQSGQHKVSLIPEQSVVNVELSPDARFLAVAYHRTDRTVVFDTASGKSVATLTGPAYPGDTPERSDGVGIGAVAWSPDGKYLAVCNSPPFFASIASLYDAKFFDLKVRFFAHAANRSYCLTFSPDSTLLACGTQDGQVKVFDVAAATAAWDARAKAVAGGNPKIAATVAQLLVDLGSEDFERREAASSDLIRLGTPVLDPLKKLAANASDAEVRLRAQAIVKQLTEAVDGPLKGLVPIHTLNVPRNSSVRSLAFSPDGRLLAVGCMKFGTPEGQLELWQLDKPQRPRNVVKDKPVNWLAFSPDGKWVASGLTGGDILLTEMQ